MISARTSWICLETPMKYPFPNNDSPFLLDFAILRLIESKTCQFRHKISHEIQQCSVTISFIFHSPINISNYFPVNIPSIFHCPMNISHYNVSFISHIYNSDPINISHKYPININFNMSFISRFHTIMSQIGKKSALGR